MLWFADLYRSEELAPRPSEPECERFLSKLLCFTNDIQPPTKRPFFVSHHGIKPDASSVVRTRALAHGQALEC